MPNIVSLTATNPDQLLNAAAYGTGAVMQVQSGPSSAGVFVDDGVVGLVAATNSYTYYDVDGASTTWYRTRYENAAGTVTSDWSDVFQADASTALSTYVNVTNLKLRLGITGTAQDVVLDQICDETNQWIESYVGRVLGPVPSATYTFDAEDNDTLDVFNLGVQSISLLQTASYTGGTLSTVSPSEYFIRPLNRFNGEPGTRIEMYPGSFYAGYGTVAVTMVAGFLAVPDDVRGVAIAIATRSWHGRQSGQADVVGSDDTGGPIVSTIVAPEHKRTLDRYSRVLVY